MKRSKPYFASFGSVSSGTMRPEDLIPAFASALDDLKTSKSDRALIREAEALDFDAEDFDADDADSLLDCLIEALDSRAPSYGYFGSHPGDGADYGFWLSEGFEHEFDGLKVESTSDVPKGYTGEVLQVSDHGNLALYAYSRGRSREVWSLV